MHKPNDKHLHLQCQSEINVRHQIQALEQFNHSKNLSFCCLGVSTDLTEQISRRFQGYSRRDLKKKSRTCLHCFGPICNVPNEQYLMEHVMSSNQRSSLCYSTDYNINNIFILHSSMHKQCHIIM